MDVPRGAVPVSGAGGIAIESADKKLTVHRAYLLHRKVHDTVIWRPGSSSLLVHGIVLCDVVGSRGYDWREFSDRLPGGIYT